MDFLTAGAAAKGVIIIDGGKVADTVETTLPVLKDGFPAAPELVGDGIAWTGGVPAELRNLAVSASGRNAFLIDGPVASGSRLEHITLEAGDQAKGIVQQRSSGSDGPTVGPGVSPIEQTADERFAVASAVQPPPILQE